MPEGFFDANGIYHKACSKCTKDFAAAGEPAEFLVASENFYHNKNLKDGYTSWCKRCYREYQRGRKQSGGTEKKTTVSRAAELSPEEIVAIRKTLGLGPHERLALTVVNSVVPKQEGQKVLERWQNLTPMESNDD